MDYAKIIGPLIVFSFMAYGLYTWISDNTGTFILIILVLAAIVGLFIFLAFSHDDMVERRIWQGMPENSPMKVNLEIEQRKSEYRLHIDVKMGRRDWKAISGVSRIHRNILFEYPSKYGDHEKLPYQVGSLLRIKHVDFDTLSEATAAKEELIRNLHAIRSLVEAQHDFAARPAGRKESLEI
jgi:hypothetical protein